MENQTIEICDICAELEKLALSGILPQRTADACAQAASVLERMRELILAGLPESIVVEKLKRILAEQGEG